MDLASLGWVLESAGQAPSEPGSGPRLPTGRHGLPREYVRRNQRDRLIASVIAAVAAEGYNEATVAKIIARAGVSRPTFYQHFRDRSACFLAAYGRLRAYLDEVAAAAAAGQPDWPAELAASIDAVLACFAANPDLVRFCLAPNYARDEALSSCYHGLLAAVAARLFAGAPAGQRRSAAFEEALVGGVAFLLFARVGRGEADHLPDLAPEITGFLLAPYPESPRAAVPAAA